MFNLLPKDTVFFDLFEGLATHAVSCSEHLRRLAVAFPKIEVEVQRIRQEEHQADDLAHTALDRLDRTFITPFDREDIHTLVNELDNVVDMVDALAKRFTLYNIKNMEPVFVKQCEVLVRATATLSEAVHRLRKSRKLSELSDKLIDAIIGVPDGVAICALPGIVAAVAKASGISRELVISMIDSCWEIIGDLKS
jgi:uncharacterized protein Yka (UPF0111/DUF47 family)